MNVDVFTETVTHADTRQVFNHYLFRDVIITHIEDYYTGLTSDVLAHEQFHIEVIHGLIYPQLKGRFGYPSRQDAFNALGTETGQAFGVKKAIPPLIKKLWLNCHTPNYEGDIFYLSHRYKKQLQKFEDCLSKNQPAILIITGPTGSGKTTLLNHLMQILNYKKQQSFTTTENESIFIFKYPSDPSNRVHCIDDFKPDKKLMVGPHDIGDFISTSFTSFINNAYKVILTIEDSFLDDKVKFNLEYAIQQKGYSHRIFHIESAFNKQMKLPNL